MQILFFLKMFVALIALLIDNVFCWPFQLGQIMMKLGVQGHWSGPNPTKKSICYNKFMWFVGFNCCGISQLVHILCLPYFDLILSSTLILSSILSGIFLSWCLLKEPLNPKYDCTASVIIISASAGIVFMTNKEQ